VRYTDSERGTTMEVYSSTKKLYVYLKSLNVVHEQELSSSAGTAGAGEDTTVNIASLGRLSKLYYFNFVNSKEPVAVLAKEDHDRFHFEGDLDSPGYRLQLTPKDITQGFASVEIWVSPDGTLLRNKSTSVESRVVDILFTDIKKDVTIADKEFNFEIPASAQVIKNALLNSAPVTKKP
jgi:outer membrane lipoprotein-sorting protein